MNESSLRADRDIQKILISTTSRLVGEYVSDALLITHAFGIHSHIGLFEGPYSRNAFVVVLRTEAAKPAIMVPDYTYYGDVICSYLAILFGKRFDNHGMLENAGSFDLPDYSLFQSTSSPRLPQNVRIPRRDLAIPLELQEFQRLAPLLGPSIVDSRFLRFLVTAGGFYLQALQNFERRPAIAYLDLVTAGEVLSGFFDYTSDDLLDKPTKTVLARIEQATEQGACHVRFIKKRLRQVRRAFVRTLDRLVSSAFFDNSESEDEFHVLKQTDFSQRMAAAYDLRSAYLHAGLQFGRLIAPTQNREIVVGKPVVEDKGFQRNLMRAPSYFGLERAIRFSLLRFIHLYSGYALDPRLDD